MKTQPSVFQSEESHGYQELVDAAKRVESVPAAMCSVKEVWADYNVSSDTIILFRKVLHLHHNGRVVTVDDDDDDTNGNDDDDAGRQTSGEA